MLHSKKVITLWALVALFSAAWLPAGASAQNTPSGAAQDTALQEPWQALQHNLQQIETLQAQLQSVPQTERKAVTHRMNMYRQGALKASNKLLDALLADREQGADIGDWKKQVAPHYARLGEMSTTHIQQLQQQIEDIEARISELSGNDHAAAEAQRAALAERLDESYRNLVTHITTGDQLSLSTESLRPFMQQQLRLEAETLAGYIDMAASELKQLRDQAAQQPGNADLQSLINQRQRAHQFALDRLHHIVTLMARLDLNVDTYQTMLLQMTGSLSADALSGDTLTALVQGWVEQGQDWLRDNTPQLLLNTLLFLLILFVFHRLSKWSGAAVGKSLDRSNLNLTVLLKKMIVSFVAGAVLAVGLLVALSQIGISLGPMLAGLGVAGFILGFALQDTLGNFASGFMILIYRPYDVDDVVEIAGAFGKVQKMNLVSTTMTTFDNQILVIPNSKIWGDIIKNVTGQEIRRVDLQFGIGYGDDIEKAEAILQDVVSAHDKVLPEPAPTIKLHNLGDSSVDFIVRPWAYTANYWDVYWDITRTVKMRFDAEGVSIPFPQRDVHVYQEAVAQSD